MKLLNINWIAKVLVKLIFINISYQYISIINSPGSSISYNNIYMNNISTYAALEKKIHNLKNNQQCDIARLENVNHQRLLCKILDQEIDNYCYLNSNLYINIELDQNNWVNHILRCITADNIFVTNVYNAEIFSKGIDVIPKVVLWQVDFHRPQEGGQVLLMMYQEILNIKCNYSQLIGAFLGSENKDYYTIRVKNTRYYDLNGIYVIKGFLRFPTAKQFRISSNFNLRRLNPITGRMGQHRGVDFAMPQGTPVLAVGDGRVVVAKHSDGAGFYITVRHGRVYTTRYMHLYKLLVKQGQKVKRGDRIALSGNSGRSTGPHLHYEVWINKQPVNPLTAKLPRTEWLISKDHSYYIVHINKSYTVPQLYFNQY